MPIKTIIIKTTKATPHISVTEWAASRLKAKWFEIQLAINELGIRTHEYMINYISSNKKRGDSPHVDGTVRLEDSIELENFGGFGSGQVGFGIGRLDVLQAKSPYWYVLNYGFTSKGERYVPNYGGLVRGEFSPSGRPDASKANGNEPFIYSTRGYGMYPKRPIRPINYIEAAKFRLGNELRIILSQVL